MEKSDVIVAAVRAPLNRRGDFHLESCRTFSNPRGAHSTDFEESRVVLPNHRLSVRQMADLKFENKKTFSTT